MSIAPRIVTVTLNASIDQTATIPDFTAGKVNRVAWEKADAGGKGVNVASCRIRLRNRRDWRTRRR